MRPGHARPDHAPRSCAQIMQAQIMHAQIMCAQAMRADHTCPGQSDPDATVCGLGKFLWEDESGTGQAGSGCPMAVVSWHSDHWKRTAKVIAHAKRCQYCCATARLLNEGQEGCESWLLLPAAACWCRLLHAGALCCMLVLPAAANPYCMRMLHPGALRAPRLPAACRMQRVLSAPPRLPAACCTLHAGALCCMLVSPAAVYSLLQLQAAPCCCCMLHAAAVAASAY